MTKFMGYLHIRFCTKSVWQRTARERAHASQLMVFIVLMAGFVLGGCQTNVWPASSGEPPGSNQAPNIIAFSLHKGNIVVNAAFKPGHTLPFVFDSGLEGVDIVSPATAKKLGLKPHSKARITTSGGQKVSAGETTVKRLWVGNQILGEQRILIAHIPDAMTHRRNGPPIAGILGTPFMNNVVVCIDYAHQQLRRLPRLQFKAQGMTSIPMLVRHGVPMVTVDIDGMPATLVVDTGNNSGVTLLSSFAKQHHLRHRYYDFEQVKGVGGGGEPTTVDRTRARHVRLGQHTTLKNVELVFLKSSLNPKWGINGYLGAKILARINPCLDMEGQRLLWNASQIDK